MNFEKLKEKLRRRNNYIKKAEFTVLVPSAIPMKTHTITIKAIDVPTENQIRNQMREISEATELKKSKVHG